MNRNEPIFQSETDSFPQELHTGKTSWWALSPLLVFLLLYLGTSVVIGDFYKVPIAVAFLGASVFAVAITRGIPLGERIACFSQGAAHRNILLMIWIFVLSGAFAGSAKAMGAIDATVDLTLRILPGNLLLGGIFLAACFISLSIGTSVGTIVALVPVAVGIAERTDVAPAFMTAIVVGGAFFGDNLSFISDTTIAATRTQECRMRDKFKVNGLIAAPAALIVLLIYLLLGRTVGGNDAQTPVEFIKILPYLAVLVTAVAGMDVIAVLVLGISITGITGLATGSFGALEWMGSLNGGIMEMGELIVITLLAGGLLELIRRNGGIAWLIERLTRRVRSRRGAELSIAALVSLANLCTANNTIAIITVGPIARGISLRFGLDNRKTASILDTFSCFVQGLIPYGAQILIAAGLTALSPLEILRYLYYPAVLGICALASILLRYPRKYS